MTQWKEHSEKGFTGGQTDVPTDRRTEVFIRAAWSQLKHECFKKFFRYLTITSYWFELINIYSSTFQATKRVQYGEELLENASRVFARHVSGGMIYCKCKYIRGIIFCDVMNVISPESMELAHDTQTTKRNSGCSLPAWWALWLLRWPLADSAMFQWVYWHLQSVIFWYYSTQLNSTQKVFISINIHCW